MKFFNLMLEVWHRPIFKITVLRVARIIPDRMYIKLTGGGQIGI